MTNETLYKVLSDINEKYVKEAREYHKAKKPVWLKWGAMAACLCLVSLCVLHMNAETEGSVPGGATIGAEDLGNRDGENESYKEAIAVPSIEIGEPDTEFEDAPSRIVDANAPNMDGINNFEAIWGGAYLDENLRWVVWLTENTPKRQAEVFKQNPSLPEDSTTFRTANFSLAYLTELLEHISSEMRDGKLPFVSSAAVMEQRNRVSVTMTIADADTMAIVSSFDTLGGAIEFHNGTAATNH